MSRLNFKTLVAVMSAAALAASLVLTTTPAGATTRTTDVVYVHGIGCGSIEYTSDALQYQMRAAGESPAKLHNVKYYACDTTGDSILTEGRASYLPSPDDNGTETSVARISYELAWYLWNSYGARGLPVDLVGHSMGGVIITYALQRIAAHDPNYPTSLKVPSVITYSAPFGGVTTALCKEFPPVECSQLLTGSTLINSVEAAGAVSLGGTQWTIIGSDGADEIPSSSTLDLKGATYKVDYTSPEYTHTSYFTDTSTASNARGKLNGVAFTAGPRSMALMTLMLH